MAKAQILQDLGNGQYRVEVSVDQTYTQALLARLNAKITYIQGEVTLAEAELDSLRTTQTYVEGQNLPDIYTLQDTLETQEKQLEYLQGQLARLEAQLAALQAADPQDDAAIAAKQAEIASKQTEVNEQQSDVDETKSSIDDKQSEVDAARQAVEDQENAVAYIKTRQLALEKRYEFTARLAILSNFTTTAWCCDLTEGLTGIVPVIEVGTEYKTETQVINILPAYEDGAGLPAYNETQHGMLYPFFSLGTADGLRNFIAYPAIQKWAPTYRYGSISSIDYENNTCTVALETLTSSILDIAINQTNNLTDVPIEYMFCDAGAFEGGDSVVVQFIDHDWAQPKVIGFKREPKPCGWEEPWDGPGVQWKYPWTYTYGFVGGSGSQATRQVVDGELEFNYPATDSGSGCIEQYHYLQYLPSNLVVTKNVSKIKFDANADLNCFDQEGSDHSKAYLVVIGWDEEELTLINYVCYILKTQYYTGVGCIDYPGYGDNETNWSLISEGNSSIWWLPGGPYPYRTYNRQILSDKEEYFAIPETLSTVLAIGIETSVEWVGGAISNTPNFINGLSMTCNLIALA